MRIKCVCVCAYVYVCVYIYIYIYSLFLMDAQTCDKNFLSHKKYRIFRVKKSELHA